MMMVGMKRFFLAQFSAVTAVRVATDGVEMPTVSTPSASAPNIETMNRECSPLSIGNRVRIAMEAYPLRTYGDMKFEHSEVDHKYLMKVKKSARKSIKIDPYSKNHIYEPPSAEDVYSVEVRAQQGETWACHTVQVKRKHLEPADRPLESATTEKYKINHNGICHQTVKDNRRWARLARYGANGQSFIELSSSKVVPDDLSTGAPQLASSTTQIDHNGYVVKIDQSDTFSDDNDIGVLHLPTESKDHLEIDVLNIKRNHVLEKKVSYSSTVDINHSDSHDHSDNESDKNSHDSDDNSHDNNEPESNPQHRKQKSIVAPLRKFSTTQQVVDNANLAESGIIQRQDGSDLENNKSTAAPTDSKISRKLVSGRRKSVGIISAIVSGRRKSVGLVNPVNAGSRTASLSTVPMLGRLGRVVDISHLVAPGADPNTPDSKGRNTNIKYSHKVSKYDPPITSTVLMKQAGKGKITVIQPLIDRGAKPYLQNNNGWTSLHYAAYSDHSDVVKVLIQNASSLSDLNIQCFEGHTALHLAARKGRKASMMTLIEHGADVHVLNEGGNTALHLAVKYRKPDVLKMLIDAGIHSNIKNSKGQTALDIEMSRIRSNLAKKTVDNWDSLDAMDDCAEDAQSDLTNNEIIKLLEPIAMLQSNLERTAKASQQLHYHLTMCTTVLGVCVAVASLTFGILLEMSVLSSDEFGDSAYYRGLFFPFILVAILGILPNDSFTIRAVACFLQFFLTVGGLWTVVSALALWFSDRQEITHYDGTNAIRQCGADLPMMGCVVQVVFSILFGVCGLVTSWFIHSTLHRFPDEPVFDRKQKKGFRFRDGAFQLPARIALEKLWFYMRMMCMAGGILGILYAVIFKALGNAYAPFFTNDRFTANLFFGFVHLIPIIAFTDTRRRSIKVFLTSMISKGEFQSAASVAALLGGITAADGLSLAKEKFRCIDWVDLTQEDFADNREKQNETNHLFDQTEVIKLGRCDAFISHSWSDSGGEKFQILEQWAADFKEKKGRSPKFWFDKACINQTDIESDLICLPMFLAGCNELIILAGETYTERLWCIMEVFAFLNMGGSAERITILPIGLPDKEAAIARFDHVDVNECKCYSEIDRQKLLSIIEQGFGDPEKFNAIVRQVFTERVKRSINTMPDIVKKQNSRAGKFPLRGK